MCPPPNLKTENSSPQKIMADCLVPITWNRIFAGIYLNFTKLKKGQNHPI